MRGCEAWAGPSLTRNGLWFVVCCLVRAELPIRYSGTASLRWLQAQALLYQAQAAFGRFKGLIPAQWVHGVSVHNRHEAASWLQRLAPGLLPAASQQASRDPLAKHCPLHGTHSMPVGYCWGPVISPSKFCELRVTKSPRCCCQP